jgi:hypothetical protein
LSGFEKLQRHYENRSFITPKQTQMKEYLLLFRNPVSEGFTPPTQEQMAGVMEAWTKWMNDLAQQGKFTGGQPLTQDGKLMKTKTSITDAPFIEGKEVVNGYLLIKASGYDEAVELSKGCPAFDDGGTVEVREIAILDM